MKEKKIKDSLEKLVRLNKSFEKARGQIKAVDKAEASELTLARKEDIKTVEEQE